MLVPRTSYLQPLNWGCILLNGSRGGNEDHREKMKSVKNRAG
jgi:hypothetical protein